MTGWQTLLKKEVLRFWKVAFQTVAALAGDECQFVALHDVLLSSCCARAQP